MELCVELGGLEETRWAQTINLTRHYIGRKVHPQKRAITYTVCHQGNRVGMVMVGIPHATKNKGWWGYPGLPTQWQVVDICRVWLEPAVQAGGALCHPDVVPGFIDRKGIWRPAAATWAVRQVMSRIQEDWLSMWPPVFPDQPYHVELIISYHDPKFHKGTIYQQLGGTPMYSDRRGNAIPSPHSGKFGWCWPVETPCWVWTEIEIKRPRSLRLEL